MLAFTPEVVHALAWFDATHELENADGRVWWARKWLPGPGSVGDQDERLMAALDLLRRVHDEWIRRQARKTDVETDG